MGLLDRSQLLTQKKRFRVFLGALINGLGGFFRQTACDEHQFMKIVGFFFDLFGATLEATNQALR
jgi:hypothetical protein